MSGDRNMKVIVFGGMGFIGSNLCNHLARKGHKVTAVDNGYLGAPENLSIDVKLVSGDVTNHADVIKAFARTRPDHVFMLAAYSSAPMFNLFPEQGLHVNICGFANVIEQCRTNHVPLTYASTSSVYSGNPLPYKENQVVVPKTHYDFSLYVRELLANIYDVRTVGFRFFSVYGPNEEHKTKYANLVSQFLWTLKNNEQPVIYGDGKQTRDFTHVKDVVQALEMSMTNQKMRGVYNVGTGRSYSINRMVRMLRQTLKTGIKPRYIQNPIKKYVGDTRADISKIRKLGYRPKVSLKTGVKKLCKNGT